MSAPRTTAELVAALRTISATAEGACGEAADRLEKLAPLELAAREFAEAEYPLPLLSCECHVCKSFLASCEALRDAAREVAND